MMKPVGLPSTLSLVLLGAALGLFTTALHAATIPVTNLNDDGSGSLRQAIVTAVSGDTVDATSLTGTIFLTTGQLVVDKSLTIQGPGAALLTVSGSQASRVFNITYGTPDSTISGLTIADGVATDGASGGGIYMTAGNVTLDGCTIRDNRAVINGYLGYGGGIAANGAGRLTLQNCTVSGNAAGQEGGGIASFIPLTIVNSTISGNQSTYGGGISTRSSILTLANSTIAQNNGRMGGGIYSYQSSRVYLNNTIVASNFTPTQDLMSEWGMLTFLSQGYNLLGSYASSSMSGQVTDLVNLAPVLGPLQDNGGPTFTHALLAGSPAIDAGDPASTLTLDQRGLPRPFNGRIDIGAFEVQELLCDTPTVTLTGPASGAVFAVNTAVTFTATFTGENAPHTATWTIDGNIVPGVVDELTQTVTATVTFTSAGVYPVQLTVANDCGNNATSDTVGELAAQVVIYDPSAGFVTGGGWINSPAGAANWVGAENLTGKASFGFVSRYKKGQTVPTGETEFQFKAGALSFKSNSYEWLVVSGARAQYKGEGTVNGTPGYGFLLTAIDGQVSGGGGADKFRIKIWNSGGVVYDNQMGADDSATPTTTLGGGSIVIRK